MKVDVTMLKEYWDSLAGSNNNAIRIVMIAGGIQWLIALAMTFEMYIESVEELAGALGMLVAVITMMGFVFYGGIAILYFPFWLMNR